MMSVDAPLPRDGDALAILQLNGHFALGVFAARNRRELVIEQLRPDSW